MEDFSKNSIMLDSTFLFDQYANRGIGRYGQELYKRLIPLAIESDWQVILIGFHDLEKNLVALKFSKFSIEELLTKVSFYSFGEPTLSTPKNYNIWKKTYKLALREYSPTVFYAAHFERGLPTVPAFAEELLRIPKTGVLGHDAIPMIFNKFSSKSFIHNYFKKKFYKKMFDGIKSANLVIAPSELSRNDLIKVGVDVSKIKKIYHGVDDIFFKDNFDEEQGVIDNTLNKFNIKNQEYFLYDSGIEPNKGVKDLLEIFSNLRKSDEKLVITGKDFEPGEGDSIKAKSPLGKIFLRLAKKNNCLGRIVCTGFVSDEELVILFSYCKAYWYMSEYEGFGFGPVQAMAAEVPAIAANRSCIPEITAGAAFLVDTFDNVKAADKISKFLKKDSEVKEYIKKGKKIVKKYNWENTAEQTWEELKNLAI